MNDADFKARFEAAKQVCFTGHEAGCTYGGMSPSTGYWLRAGGCDLTHGDDDPCAICRAEATTGFCDWGDDLWSIWYVATCQPCATRMQAMRDAEPRPVSTVCPACGLTFEEFVDSPHTVTVSEDSKTVTCMPSGATAPFPEDVEGIQRLFETQVFSDLARRMAEADMFGLGNPAELIPVIAPPAADSDGASRCYTTPSGLPVHVQPGCPHGRTSRGARILLGGPAP